MRHPEESVQQVVCEPGARKAGVQAAEGREGWSPIIKAFACRDAPTPPQAKRGFGPARC